MAGVMLERQQEPVSEVRVWGDWSRNFGWSKQSLDQGGGRTGEPPGVCAREVPLLGKNVVPGAE